MRVRRYAHERAQTFSEKVIASIIYDGRFGLSVVAFRTAPPIGGLSLCYLLTVDEWTRLDKCFQNDHICSVVSWY